MILSIVGFSIAIIFVVAASFAVWIIGDDSTVAAIVLIFLGLFFFVVAMVVLFDSVLPLVIAKGITYAGGV